MSRLTVGLTGGIASGKSLVADSFTRRGVPVLDADLVAREVVAPGQPALARIARHFGSDYLLPDGQLDRRRMRELVFARPQARRELEQITHPAIRESMTRWRDAQDAPYRILSVAILLEAGMQDLVQRVLVVDTAPEVQLERLRGRDGIGEELARQMLAAQATREQRLAAAHDVLVNQGSPAETDAMVGQLHAFYLGLAASADLTAPGICLPNSVG